MEDPTLKSTSQTEWDKETSLEQFIEIIWSNRRVLIAAVATAMTVALIVVIWLPETYTSSTLLRPKQDEEAIGTGTLARQFGGLASIAGINIPSGAGETRTKLAIEVLRSKKFSSNVVKKYDLLPTLSAGVMLPIAKAARISFTG